MFTIPKMKLISTKTDPAKSKSNYYGWVEIKNDKIVSVGDDRSGVIWESKWNKDDRGLQGRMRDIARIWPNLYKQARIAASKSKLDSYKNVKRADILKSIEHIKGNITALGEQLESKHAELQKSKIELGRNG